MNRLPCPRAGSDDEAPWYMWVAVGHSDEPPTRVRVESCLDCGALVPADRFDIHGRWHGRTERPPQHT